jgi:hypothetical protein
VGGLYVKPPVADPTSESTITGVLNPLPVPVITAQVRELADDQDTVAHADEPRDTLAVTSILAKFTPSRVIDDPDVGGALGLASWVSVGASYVKESTDVPIEPVMSAKSLACAPLPMGDDSQRKLVSLVQIPKRPFFAQTFAKSA